jgi:hypothetical protein
VPLPTTTRLLPVPAARLPRFIRFQIAHVIAFQKRLLCFPALNNQHKNSKTTPFRDGKYENFFVFTNELHAQPQASHSKSMLSVWPSRQRATLAILKLLPVSKLFAAAVTDGIQARQHARFIRPHMTTPPFKRRWPLSQRL